MGGTQTAGGSLKMAWGCGERGHCSANPARWLHGGVGDLGDKGLLSSVAGPALRLGTSERVDFVRNALYLYSRSCSQRLS